MVIVLLFSNFIRFKATIFDFNVIVYDIEGISTKRFYYLQQRDSLQHLETCLQSTGTGRLGRIETLLQPGNLLP